MKKLNILIFCIVSFNITIVSSELGSKNLAPFYVAREMEQKTLEQNSANRKKELILSLRENSKEKKELEVKPKEHEIPVSLEVKKEESLRSFLDLELSDDSFEAVSEDEKISNEKLEEFLELLGDDLAILQKRIITFQKLFKHKK